MNKYGFENQRSINLNEPATFLCLWSLFFFRQKDIKKCGCCISISFTWFKSHMGSAAILTGRGVILFLRLSSASAFETKSSHWVALSPGRPCKESEHYKLSGQGPQTHFRNDTKAKKYAHNMTGKTNVIFLVERS